MALKSQAQEQEKGEVIEEALDDLDKTLDRLKTLYEQYFLGIQKTPPSFIHSDVERKLRDLTQLNIRNTGLRYRFNTLQQKFGSYNSYWRRTLRQIENGTYARNLQRVGKKAAKSGAEIPEEILAAMPKRMREQIVRDRENALAIAKRRQPGAVAAAGDFAREENTQEDLVLDGGDTGIPEIDEAPAIIEDRKKIHRSHSGSLLLDENEEFDIDGFLAKANEEAAEEEIAQVRKSREMAAVQPPPNVAPPSITPGRVVPPSQQTQAIPGFAPQRGTGSFPQPPQRGTGSFPQPPRNPSGGYPAVKPAELQPALRNSGDAPVAPRNPSGGYPVVPPRAATQPGAAPPHQMTTAMPRNASGGYAAVPPPMPAPRPSTAPAIPPPIPKAASQVTKPNPIRPGSSEQRVQPAPPTVGGRAAPAPEPRERDTQVGPAPTAPTAPMRPPPGMTDADVNALYSKYVKAKEMVGEQTGPQTRDKLLRTINAQAPKIMEQYKAKGVDFSIVVKDNQVIIKAKPKT